MGISHHMGNELDCFIHQSYGRVRIRVPSLREAAEKGEALIEALSRLRGVRKISLSEITGSVVIYYDPSRQQLGSILRAFHGQGYLSNVHALPRTRILLPVQVQTVQADWLTQTIQLAGKVILINIVEGTLQRTGRILMRRIFS